MTPLAHTSLDPGAVAHFDALFEAADDPWHTASDRYERRKRARLLASLPRGRFARAFEPACANGVLTRVLAARCDELLAMDASRAAVARARDRLAARSNVRVHHGTVPDDWPDGRFDLVVLSEFGYYLPPSALPGLARRARGSLVEGGTIVACHWRHAADDFRSAPGALHAALRHAMGRPPRVRHVDADFLLEAWTAGGASR